ncbi:F0F1 ATP synthase subunit B family protein [Oecophyllibacter saccharovorans]|uniref:F0F1 ATP synthase subunit B family protein n=1 Tax=Oecophyllibacter saccharovorans TaxID=2558360 RepID=UPI00117422DB|nr:F0F1 ATP synthase subunit B [Oecophyllibacter saccharovorans]TPW33750.1 F0F1 ATP synthase subunit B [Oecophyllibacter saccharovorans]
MTLFQEPRFWVTLSFVLFFVIFGPKIWRVLVKALDARADGIRANLDEATRLRREAEQMLEDATREREQAKIDAQKTIAASEAEAEALKENAAREAEEMTKLHEKLAQERIEAAEQAALREIREQAMDVALQASREVVTRKLADDEQLADLLIEQSLKALPRALREEAA